MALALAPRPDPAAPAAPEGCWLCGGWRVALRFPARGQGLLDPRAFHCTSFGHRRHPPIWRCRDCGLLFQSPRPPEAELLAAYGAVEDPVYLAES